MGANGVGVASPVVLLVEDDEGDALLVTELLGDAEIDVRLRRATTVELALGALAAGDVECVLLDLGLPDATGLDALARLRDSAAELAAPPAFVVLTGDTDTDRGMQAVAAGADDYLVKGDTDPAMLGRSLRYALQRRYVAAQQRALFRSEVRAAETARLERALLPTPLVDDPRISVVVGYLPGRESLLGGDFYDTVELPNGTVLSVVGDVSGHGPDEAALGATLRTAWRTLVLTGTPADAILPFLERVLLAERASEDVFVTLCMVVMLPGRFAIDVYLAGHPAPLIVTGPLHDALCTTVPSTYRGRALGIPVAGGWQACTIDIAPPYLVVLYTDGLIETFVRPQAGAISAAPDHSRLGVDGLRRVITRELKGAFNGFVTRVLRGVRELHGGPLADDAALLALGWTTREGAIGQRSAVLADSAEWVRG